MRVGLITPNYPNEKRVAVLPRHMSTTPDTLLIESGFGATLEIADDEYAAHGCVVSTRREIFAECDAIFSLKLLQLSDYAALRRGQMVIGWTHPFGSGAAFMRDAADPKELVVVDLDNIEPRVFHCGRVRDIPFIPTNFIWTNSFMAGVCSVEHAMLAFGMRPTANVRVAVLSAGNVAQGAYTTLIQHGCDARLYYRRTLGEFYAALEQFDVIVNGIEITAGSEPILSVKQQRRLRKGCLVIDAAADAGGAIEGTRYTSIDAPIYCQDGVFYYVVNNAPSLYYRTVSCLISEALWPAVFKAGVARFRELIDSPV